MNVLIVNSGCGIGSVGRICVKIAEDYEKEGNVVKITYGRDRIVPAEYQKYSIRVGSDLDLYEHVLLTRIFDLHGFGSKRATRKFLDWADEFNPEVVWIHNVHGYYINIELLFEWIKRRPWMKVMWTLHDCWAFTGHCVHFESVGCNKWIEGCYNCPQKKRYPTTLFIDNCKNNYDIKRKIFTGIKNLQLYVPSKWLKDKVDQSFLAEYSVQILPNTVNELLFCPRSSNFKQKYMIGDQIVLLGVAFQWNKYKGLYDFLELRKLLSNNYLIVLVGLNTKEIKRLPNGILGIEKTDSIDELVNIYCGSDLYLNLSKEETFGMTTLEAIKCGKHVLVYKNTACQEIAEKYGELIADQDIGDVRSKIVKLFGKE